jgi:hypothetical protein
VVAVLRSLIQKRSLISAYFNNGRFFMLTSLLRGRRGSRRSGFRMWSRGEDQPARPARRAGVDDDHGRPDQGAVRPRQACGNPERGLPAFSAELPGQVLRLQRREYYRLSTPLTKPVKFVARIRRADGSALIVEASLLDLSGGGICLMVTPQMAELLQRGDILTECKMTLPDEGQLVASLYIRNKLEVATRGGSRYLRVGCQFLDLPGARMSMVQRYINRVERERKARLSGMA